MPCSSTGASAAIPTSPWLEREADIASLAAMQRRLLDRADRAGQTGGTLMYCTCSLEPEERASTSSADLLRPRTARAATADRRREVAGQAEFISPDGDLRTLPCHLPMRFALRAALGGFYAARLAKVARLLTRGFGRFDRGFQYGAPWCPCHPAVAGRAIWRGSRRGERVDVARCSGE